MHRHIVSPVDLASAHTILVTNTTPEWCWLLEWYGRLRDRQVKQYVDALYNSAIKNGLNKETGFLTNEYRLDGTSLLSKMSGLRTRY